MKKLLTILAAAAAVFCARGASDDSVVANRKWVRNYVASNMADVVRQPPALTNVGDSVTCRSVIPDFADGDTEIEITAYIPTNRALFVAWTTEPRVAAYSFYAKAPEGRVFTCATNDFIRDIACTVTNWQETVTNDAREVVRVAKRAVRWEAVDSTGARWVGGYREGNTALVNTRDYTKYFIIQDSYVTDAAARILLGSPSLAESIRAAPSVAFPFFGLFVRRALAEEHLIYDDSGKKATLGFHEAVAIGELQLVNKTGTKRFQLIPDGKDHQYNPYGGRSYFDLGKGESEYRTHNMKSDPKNWGYSFPILVQQVDNDGNPIGDPSYLSEERFVSTKAWKDVAALQMPEPPKEDTPEIENTKDHDCKVMKEIIGGIDKHIGCVCDYEYCPANPNAKDYYYINKYYHDGTVTTVSNKLVKTGSMHNIKRVYMDAGGIRQESEKYGCFICWEEMDSETNFCGCDDAEDRWGYKCAEHVLNDPEFTGRNECGCMCGKYRNNSTAMPVDMHLHPIQEGNAHKGEDSYCWCYCRRQHDGIIHSDGDDDDTTCPGHCTSCGAYQYVDGTELNGTHPNPVQYQLTDGETPKKSDHTPSKVRCGCKCGAFSDANYDDELIYNQIREDAEFHQSIDLEHGKCTCDCVREYHQIAKREDHHCVKICALCGYANHDKIIAAGKTFEAAPPTAEDHTPDAVKCGCECYNCGCGGVGSDNENLGVRGTEDAVRDNPAWHKRRAADGAGAYCCCECGSFAHHADKGGANAHALFVVTSECPDVCKGRDRNGDKCGYNALGEETVYADHQAKGDACGCRCGALDNVPEALEFHNGHNERIACRCACGVAHRWYDGSTDRCRVCSFCKLTAYDRVPENEDLHKLNPDAETDCTCYCGYFSPGEHAAKAITLHRFADDEDNEDGYKKCLCDCGRKHQFRTFTTYHVNLGKACPKVCAYCRERKDDDSLATEDDHDEKEVRDARCGCKCGNLTHEAKSDRFHIRKPGSCLCFGADGNGGKHHFVDNSNGGCTRICGNKSLAGHGEHLIAAYNHDTSGIVRATPYDHTRASGEQCGCQCGEFSGQQTGYHKQNTSACGCYCGTSPKAGNHRRGSHNDTCRCFCGEELIGHVFTASSCLCQCPEKKHKPTKKAHPNNYCPNVCHGDCGEAHDPDKFDLHTKSQSQCATCECGEATYGTELKYHRPHGYPYCKCACGMYHNHGESRAGCTRICKWCGGDYLTDGPQQKPAGSGDHTYSADACGCVCGRYAEPHRFADDACECRCGAKTRAHIYELIDTIDLGTRECDTCHETITTVRRTYACARCGDTVFGDSEEGHAPDCGMEVSSPPKPCNCGCIDCGCASCVGKSGNCELCGRACGGGSGGGNSGDGGNTGGGGFTGGGASLDDI